jgi:hypothetical protein
LPPREANGARTAPRLLARELIAPASTLVLYLALVVWLTWPLARHAASHVPDLGFTRMDVLHGVWVLAWQTHALVVAPATILDANIYYPAKHALLYGTTGSGTLPYFAPPFLATGNPALAANVALIVCVALAAWGLHRVVARWTGSETGGFVAGSVFLLTPWVLYVWMAPRPVHFVLLYIPWIVWLVALPGWSFRRGLLLGVLIVLQCLADPVYVAPAVAVPVALVALRRAIVPADRRSALGLAATLALALAVLAPIYAGLLIVRSENPALRSQSVWPVRNPPGEAAVEGLVLAGGMAADLRPTGVPWPALALVALGLASLLARPAADRGPTRLAWKHGALWVVAGVLISVPALIVPGEPPVILRSPVFTFLQWLVPGAVDAIRGKMRLGVGALMGIALLAGTAFAECQRRLGRQGGWAGALAGMGLVVAMYTPWPGRAVPYPIAQAPVPDTPVLAALRRSSGPVLELPAGLGPGGSVDQAEAMYRSIFHWRPLLNGYSGYWPQGFPERMELAAALPAPDALAKLRRETGLAAILVHTRAQGYDAWLQLASQGDSPLHLEARDDGDLLFVVRD